MDQRGKLWGLVLGVAFTAVLATAMLVLTYGANAGPVYGRILGFTLAETDAGSFPIARVSVDGREALVPVPRSTNCGVGNAIQLLRGKGLIGYRYRMGVRGCSAWFSSQGTTPGFGPEWTCSSG